MPELKPVDPSMGLIAHIQGCSEHQRALLARELHDELGGLLVGAMMDLAWAEQHLTASPDELYQKLSRARHSLSAAIDLKRRVIEELRPTLLDNVGLFAAVRWHMDGLRKYDALDCRIDVPTEECRFLPNVPITLFRVIQESLAVAVTKGHTASVSLSLASKGNEFHIRLVSDPTSAGAQAAVPPHSLTAIEQRAGALEGHFTHAHTPSGTVTIAVSFPLARLVAAS